MRGVLCCAVLWLQAQLAEDRRQDGLRRAEEEARQRAEEERRWCAPTCLPCSVPFFARLCRLARCCATFCLEPGWCPAAAAVRDRPAMRS